MAICFPLMFSDVNTLKVLVEHAQLWALCLHLTQNTVQN